MDLDIGLDIDLSSLTGGKNRMILGSMILGVVLILVGIISGDAALLGNLIIIAIFAFIIPVFVQKYAHKSAIKSMENQFPNFIRDLADSVRSGMSFKEAIKIASNANYGKLTDEVKEMNNRLSWGTSFLRTLDVFREHAQDSKLITESLNIITESFKSGGNVAATLDAVARDMVMFKEVEAERSSMTRQHVMIMYGIFFMFLGIAVMIIFVMVPMIESTPDVSVGGFGMTFTNPCEGGMFFPCNYYNSLGAVFNMEVSMTLYYTSMFFTIVIIQGLFTGLIAGQLGDNSIISGTKHSLIMVTVALGVFLFLAKAGLLPA